MEAYKELWERLKKVSDVDWERLRLKRDKLIKRKHRKPSAAEFVGRISAEDLDLMEKTIEEECERIDIDGWK